MSDPLDNLKQAWDQVKPPSAHPLPDPQTQAAIDWLRAAHNSRPCPALPNFNPQPKRRPFLVLTSSLIAASLVAYLSSPTRQQTTSPTPGSAQPDSIFAGLPARIHNGQIELRSGPVRLTFPTKQPPKPKSPR